MDLYPPEQPSKEEAPATKPSFLWRTARRARLVASGPVAMIGIREISDGGRCINGFLDVLRNGPPVDTRLKTTEGGQIDLMATAFDCGISVEALAQRFRATQSQTALAAYVLLGLGVGLLLLWLYAALHMTMSRARMAAAIEYLPFCAVCFLLAFKSAWMNWQLRMRRLGSAVAYLRTTGSFVPR